MSDTVRVVIEIPKETYLEIREGFIARNALESAEAIKSGTLLPKGHGRLIDEKVAYRKFYARCLAKVATEVFTEIPTIIEADEVRKTEMQEEK